MSVYNGGPETPEERNPLRTTKYKRSPKPRRYHDPGKISPLLARIHFDK